MTITVPATVAADVPSATTLVNDASVGADELVGTTSDTGSLDVTTSADVAIIKTGAATYTPGTNYTWHLRVRNLGPSDARAVAHPYPLLAGHALSCPPTRRRTEAGGTVTCALGTLAPGADHTYDVTVTSDGDRTGAPATPPRSPPTPPPRTPTPPTTARSASATAVAPATSR